MMYHDNPNRSVPENWTTESYTVRRLGSTAWEKDISTLTEAEESQAVANRVVGCGHQIVAEQVFGDNRRSVVVAEYE